MTDVLTAGVEAWLLGSDPAIAWQTRRDVLGRPEAEWLPERARVETEGRGSRLLAEQDADGQWAGGTFVPAGFDRSDWEREGQPWTATSFVVTQLRLLGLDPASDAARRTVRLLGDHACWFDEDWPFWGGETEECINGRLLADGAYFGVDMSPLLARLLGEQQPDGGWNCERENGSTRSSFDTTINVLEGLLEHERTTGGTPESRAARLAGEEFLLERGLFRRMSTGEPAVASYLELAHPHRWHYDVLRGLDHVRAAAAVTGDAPDPRLGDAVDHVRSRRTGDGRWLLDGTPPGRVWFSMDDGVGRPSRWVTLLALRVLAWWDNPPSPGRPSPGTS